MEEKRKNEEECGGIDMKLLKRPIGRCNKTSEVQDEVRRRIVIRVTRYFPCPFCFCPIRRGLLWKSNIFEKKRFNLG